MAITMINPCKLVDKFPKSGYNPTDQLVSNYHEPPSTHDQFLTCCDWRSLEAGCASSRTPYTSCQAGAKDF